jgi:hypothetical protein
MVVKNHLHSPSDVHTGRVGHNGIIEKPVVQINILPKYFNFFIHYNL